MQSTDAAPQQHSKAITPATSSRAWWDDDDDDFLAEYEEEVNKRRNHARRRHDDDDDDGYAVLTDVGLVDAVLVMGTSDHAADVFRVCNALRCARATTAFDARYRVPGDPDVLVLLPWFRGMLRRRLYGALWGTKFLQPSVSYADFSARYAGATKGGRHAWVVTASSHQPFGWRMAV